MNRKFSEKTISRAVELWCRRLHAPIFDNGDNSESGGMAHALATINIHNDKSKIKDLDASIEVFRAVLTKSIKEELENDGFVYLDTDYHPSKLLAKAAKTAGIPPSQFSIKSSVNMENDNIVSTSFGYCAEYEYHYPISNNRWLITKLRGSDISKIISSVESGNDLGLLIDG